MTFAIYPLAKYEEWFQTQTERSKLQIEKRQKKMQKNESTFSLEDFEGIGIEHNPSDYLTNTDNIGKAIVECLENNDPEGVMEVISIYLEAVNKTKLSQSSDLHRQTVYSALRHRNPTVKTLAKLMHSYAH